MFRSQFENLKIIFHFRFKSVQFLIFTCAIKNNIHTYIPHAWLKCILQIIFLKIKNVEKYLSQKLYGIKEHML